MCIEAVRMCIEAVRMCIEAVQLLHVVRFCMKKEEHS